MAWVQVEQSMMTHRKTLDLADRLGISPVTARGHLVTLWAWGLDNAEIDGTILRATPGMIARAAEWPGDPAEFYEALRAAGYLDVEDDRVALHDWPDYAGKLAERRAANAKRMRQNRAKEKSEPDDCAAHVQRTSDARAGVTQPNLTLPYQEDVLVPPVAPQPVDNPTSSDENDGDEDDGYEEYRVRLGALLERQFGERPNRRALTMFATDLWNAGVELDLIEWGAKQAKMRGENPEAYFGGMVSRWLEQCVRTVAEAKAASEAHRSRAGPPRTRSGTTARGAR